MKLRNKKTGEILEEVRSSMVYKDNFRIYDNRTNRYFTYNSLAELNAEWEDASEITKLHYVLDIDGEILPCDLEDQTIKKCKVIGNYFESKEEAEKAIEKLKAWKRLKDKGFRFNRWTIPEEPKTPHIKLVIEAEMDVPDSPYDLGLLFGGEE